MLNFKELQERCKSRNFDQITVVTRDIFRELEQLNRIIRAVPGDIQTQTQQNCPGLKAGGREIAYVQRCATVYYKNTSLCIVQPVEGDTLYQRYLDRFGEGICCVRERVPVGEWDGMLAGLKGKGLSIPQTMEAEDGQAAWVDLMDTLGILYQVVRADSREPAPAYVLPDRICQINITTPDVRKTIETLAELLEIGPWEVGSQNNRTVTDSCFRVNGKLEDAEFEFLLAILVCGNLEWEAIQPVKGPLVYFDYLNEHGIGYHHILQEVPQGQWQSRLRAYTDAGVKMSCTGKVGPITWCYMDTKEQLGFFMELRTDAVMTKLPDGYLQYFYPEQA